MQWHLQALRTVAGQCGVCKPSPRAAHKDTAAAQARGARAHLSLTQAHSSSPHLASGTPNTCRQWANRNVLIRTLSNPAHHRMEPFRAQAALCCSCSLSLATSTHADPQPSAACLHLSHRGVAVKELLHFSRVHILTAADDLSSRASRREGLIQVAQRAAAAAAAGGSGGGGGDRRLPRHDAPRDGAATVCSAMQQHAEKLSTPASYPSEAA